MPNYGTKVAKVVPAAAVAKAVAEGFNYCQDTKLSRRRRASKVTGKLQVTRDL